MLTIYEVPRLVGVVYKLKLGELDYCVTKHEIDLDNYMIERVAAQHTDEQSLLKALVAKDRELSGRAAYITKVKALLELNV